MLLCKVVGGMCMCFVKKNLKIFKSQTVSKHIPSVSVLILEASYNALKK